MEVRVGTLTVRGRDDIEKLPSGVLRPRVFRGDGEGDYTDRRQALFQGMDLHREREAILVEGVAYRARSATPDQLCAADHCRACQALDRGLAGRRARQMLFDYLSPSQRQTAERYGYFDVGLYNRGLVEIQLTYGWPVVLNTVYFRIKRGYPNGNVTMSGWADGEYREFNVCSHPIQPYPTDDICLSQLLWILKDPDEFVRAANITMNGRPVTPARMFKRYRYSKRTDLALPYLRHAPVPENVTLGNN